MYENIFTISMKSCFILRFSNEQILVSLQNYVDFRVAEIVVQLINTEDFIVLRFQASKAAAILTTELIDVTPQRIKVFDVASFDFIFPKFLPFLFVLTFCHEITHALPKQL